MAVREELDRRVLRYIREHEMVRRGSRILAGVSGGADSVCLLYLLQLLSRELEAELAVVHVEHGIRGAESLGDADFVRDLCVRLEVPCRVVRTDVPALVGAGGLSLEETARAERYRLLEEERVRSGADRIAVAHNLNDQAETVLLNMARGTGLRGMGAMRPVRDRIIRPLLGIERSEIESWLTARGISFRTDSSNLEEEYARNRVRRRILPEMETGLNPGTAAHLAAEAALLQRVEDYLEDRAAVLYRQCVQEIPSSGHGHTGISGAAPGQAEDAGTGGPCECRIRLEGFLSDGELMEEYVIRRCISRLLAERGLKDYTAGHIADIKRLTGMDLNRGFDLPGGLRAERVREGLRLFRKGEEEETRPIEREEVAVTGPGEYRIGNWLVTARVLGAEEMKDGIPEKKYTKWISYDTIKNTVRLRFAERGDRITVNREGGHKTVYDHLKDRKVPAAERSRIPVAASGDQVLWVIGGRISESAKVTRETRQILELTARKMEETS